MPSLFPDYFSGTMSDEAMVSEQPTGGKKIIFVDKGALFSQSSFIITITYTIRPLLLRIPTHDLWLVFSACSLA